MYLKNNLKKNVSCTVKSSTVLPFETGQASVHFTYVYLQLYAKNQLQYRGLDEDIKQRSINQPLFILERSLKCDPHLQ